MLTQGDITTEVLVRLNQTTTSAFYTDALLAKWLDQAHKWAAGYKKWPFTEARQSTTFASLTSDEDGMLIGIYPEGWKAESIRYMTIGGKKVDKRNFMSFREFLENNSGDTRRIYTNRGGRYYVNPTIDLNGTVTVWGQYTPILDPSDLTAYTIFSQPAEEANEAIVLKVLSYAKEKEKSPTALRRGQMVSETMVYAQKASAVLDAIYKNYLDEQYGDQTEATDGMFKRFDVTRGGFREDIFKRDQWS